MKVTQTRVITRERIDQVVDAVDVVAAMERAFVAYSSGRAVVPPVGELLFEQPPGDAHIKYGYVRGDAVFVVKIASGFYENARAGLPANSGVMLVFSSQTGLLEAVLLDDGHLTNVRTAAAGAVAAKYLAPAEVTRVGICGTGVQARMQLEYLQRVVACRRVTVWGRSAHQARAYAAEMQAKAFEVNVASTPAEVASQCNLIVTTTYAEQPLLQAADIRPGTHITAMGSDTPAKQELAGDVFGVADLRVVDSISQCQERGELHHAMAAGTVTLKDVVELGAVVSGDAPLRTTSRQITVCDLTGVAVQDIEISKAVLAQLRQ